MFCEKCGSEIPENSAFCVKCGAKNINLQTPSNKVQEVKNNDGIASIVVGILGLFFDSYIFLPILSTVAVCIGIRGAKKSEKNDKGEGTSIAGLTIGVVGIADAILTIILRVL